MPQNFIECDREQVLLMPPSLRDWLPEDHLAWFVLATAEELDLSEFYAAYRADGHGRPAHDPQMMVALLLYAYAKGERSSRGIERECTEDVAYRVISANQRPDHTTIARFLKRHEAPVDAITNQAVTHRLRVEPARGMRAISGEVEGLLDGLEERSSRRAALLASELIAQVGGLPPVSGGEPLDLTIQRRSDAVRLEATGPVAPSIQAPGDRDTVFTDPLADWGRFILDRVADRWGVGNGGRPSIWAEIEAPT